jgi:transcriptional regulator with XRE-family HTH domain
MMLRYTIAAKKAPNPTDEHVGARVRMRRKMVAMSQGQLADALGITYQQVQKNEHQSHRGQPVAANLPYPSGASSVLLRGRAERINATRFPWKRVIDGPDW